MQIMQLIVENNRQSSVGRVAQWKRICLTIQLVIGSHQVAGSNPATIIAISF